MMDFSETHSQAAASAKEAIAGLLPIGVYHAVKSVSYGNRQIAKNDFFSLEDKKIISVDKALDSVTLQTVETIAKKGKHSVLTVFYGEHIADEFAESLVERISEAAPDIEASAISTDEPSYSLMLAFE